MARSVSRAGGPSALGRLRHWLAEGGSHRARRAGKFFAWAVVIAATAGVTVFGMQKLKRRVLRRKYPGLTGRAGVYLARMPAWMPVSLGREIVADITPPQASFADAELVQKVYGRAAANPWVHHVNRVQIRPPTAEQAGIVVADLAFRRPLARVRHAQKVLFIDEGGHRLPERQMPNWVVSLQDRRGKIVRQVSYLCQAEVPAAWRRAARRIHYVVIDGVRTPPPSPGGKWIADDLAAGVQLVQLVRRRRYYAQITVVDVRNHAQRITRNEPELRLFAQIGRGRPTDIRFGRFPAPGGGDYVVSPRRKMSYLDRYAAGHAGRLAGINSYLDLRFDELHVSIN